MQLFLGGPEKTPIPGGEAVGQQAVDNAVGCHPLPEDEAVIVDGAGILFFQVGHELGRKSRIVVDGVRLAVDVRVAVEEFLEPVGGAFRIAGSVEVAVGAGQAALEHLEHVFIPSRHLVAVAVFDGHALNTGNVLFAVRTQNVHPAAKQPSRVVAADGPHKGLSPDLQHGVQNIPAEGPLRVAQHDGRPLAPQGQKALGNDHGIVQPALAGTSGSDFQIPAVGAGSEIFFLFSR